MPSILKSGLALVAILLPACIASAERAPITPELRGEIHAASIQYFDKFRSYECTYSESTETESNPFTQQTSQRVIEDGIGQIRLESTIRQVDDSGSVAATIDSVRVFDLRNETRIHSQPHARSDTPRLVTITPAATVTSLIRPKSYVLADGRPMHELLDSLREREIEVFIEEITLDSAPGRLIELSFAEPLESGDILRHTYTLDRGHNFLPLRQVVYFNKKRFRVLEPTFQEISPGVHFPVKAIRIAYNKDSEENEMRSITHMSVQSIRINTEIPADTFKLPLLPGDNVNDFRKNPAAPHLPEPNTIPLG